MFDGQIGTFVLFWNEGATTKNSINLYEITTYSGFIKRLAWTMLLYRRELNKANAAGAAGREYELGTPKQRNDRNAKR